jgi:hypothetical protein
MDNAGGRSDSRGSPAQVLIHDERTVFLLAFLPARRDLALIARVPEAKPRGRGRPDAADGRRRPPSRGILIVGIFVLFTGEFDRLIPCCFARGKPASSVAAAAPLGILQRRESGGRRGRCALDRFGRLPALALMVDSRRRYVGFAFVAALIAVWALFGFYAMFTRSRKGPSGRPSRTRAPKFAGRAFGFFHASIGIAALPASLPSIGESSAAKDLS